MKIAIISSSVREGRNSHRVALFMQALLKGRGVEVDMLDLKAFDFPLFTERYPLLKVRPAGLDDYAERFRAADGVLIVSPVYNADYPAALKNVIDVFVKEWVHKPVGVVSVTYGKTPGIATAQKIQTLVMKLGACAVPSFCTMIEVQDNFSETGEAADPVLMEKFSAPVIDELLAFSAK